MKTSSSKNVCTAARQIPFAIGQKALSQKGMTLIEIMIAMAITTVLAAAVVAAIGQVFKSNTRDSSQMMAVRQAQNIGYYVSEDAQMARSVTGSANATSPTRLEFNWVKWDGTAVQVKYQLSGTTLNRIYSENLSGTVTQSSTIVGQNIAAPHDLDSSWSSGRLTVTVTTTVGSKRETRIYQIKPRPGT